MAIFIICLILAIAYFCIGRARIVVILNYARMRLGFGSAIREAASLEIRVEANQETETETETEPSAPPLPNTSSPPPSYSELNEFWHIDY